MNNQASTEAEEEVFVDSVTSPVDQPVGHAPQQGQGLRRSTRKRKSITKNVELEGNTRTNKTIGKRHRPLGEMYRSPDNASQAGQAKKVGT